MATLTKPLLAHHTIAHVSTTDGIEPTTFIDADDEGMFVHRIGDNTLTLIRGVSNRSGIFSRAVDHPEGTTLRPHMDTV